MYTTIGALSGWAEVYTAAPSAPPVSPAAPVSPAPSPAIPVSIAPIVTAVQSPSPVVVNPIIGKKHHAKVKHTKAPPVAVGHRIRPVHDQIKPKRHHSR